MSLPSRHSPILTVSPGFTAEIIRVSSLADSMSLPSTERTTSPDLMPAFSAGLSATTDAPRAPLAEESDMLSAISCVTGWMCTPNTQRLTLPHGLGLGTRGHACD